MTQDDRIRESIRAIVLRPQQPAERGDRAVTLIQRFGSALNLNVHFHLLVLGGVYRRDGEGELRFVPVPGPPGSPASFPGSSPGGPTISGMTKRRRFGVSYGIS